MPDDATPPSPSISNGASGGLRIRRAVRALLVTPDVDILLCRFEFADGTVWALPGGGLDPGESHLDALHRELIEEVGLREPAIGAHVWNREHIHPHEDGLWDGQQDRFYVVDTPARFDPEPALGWEQLRAERLHELRWWHVDDIERAAAAADGVWFAPRRLGPLVRELAASGPPVAPIDTGT